MTARELLDAHLSAWLGAWPPSEPVTVVGHRGRVDPGWDGLVHDVIGLVSPAGIVLSVPPAVEAAMEPVDDGAGLPELGAALAAAIGRPGTLATAAFRWCEQPTDLDDVGVWVPALDGRVPEWLRPFGGEVLIAFDDAGSYLAGVGIKRHDAYGHEISVGTDERARGKGLARHLVAQAARTILAGGRVPTYLHELSNEASSRVAAAAGFPDVGWRVLAFTSG